MEGSLFAGVHYYINEKQVKNPAEVKQILKRGGASREFYISELVTHVISDEPPAGEEDGSAQEKALSPLQDHDHVAVKSDWVVMSQKCGAQLPTTPFEVSDNKLFSGLVFCPSKLPTGDVEKLCILLMFHGGKMQRRLDSSVTHLVTMETAGKKYECAEKHPSMKVISPDWILDSVEAGTRMEEKPYHPSGLKLNLVGTPGGREVCNGGVAALRRPEETPERHPQADAGTAEKLAAAELPKTNHSAIADGTSLNVSESVSTVAPPPDLAVAPPTSQEAAGGNSVAAGGGPSAPTPVARAEQLLDGVVIYFTDYQDCVEDETLDKWKLVVRQHGGDVLDMYNPEKVTHLLALHKKSVFFTRAMEEGKCIASAHWLDDVLTEQKMFPPRTPIHFPTAFQWQFPNAEAYSMTLTNYVGAERELVKDMLRICGIPYTGHLSRENTHLICKKAEGRKYEKAVEWGIQVVNSTFLADIIHNGELPMVLYPCYTTLNQSNEFHSENSMEASRILKLWKTFLSEYKLRHSDLMAKSAEEAAAGDRKREREGEMEPAEAGNRKLRKRQTEGAQPSQQPVVLFTGISTTTVKPFKQIVARLGGVVTESPRACSHIVTPKVARTIKFLSGISVCRHMVTPKWVEESERLGSFAPEADFELKDPDAEQLFGMDLPTSLARAQSRKLLEGMSVYATSSVQPPQDAFGDIVNCAGGRLLTLTEVRTMLAASRAAVGSLIVVSTPGDIENGSCKEFTALGIKVFNAELILTGVLKQILEYSQYTFLIDD